MLIKNIESIPESHKYKTNRIISDWLQRQGLPLFGVDENFYYYAKTEKLEEILKKIPFWLKIFS